MAAETAGLISERIFSGWYEQGEQLRQASLSEQLEVSRTPLRDALNLLENDGLIKFDESGRATVKAMTSRALKDAMHYRRMIETGACDLLQRNDAAVQLADFQKSLASLASDPSPRNRSRFHTELLECTRNDHLRRGVPMVRLTEEVWLPARPWYREFENQLFRFTEVASEAIVHGSVPDARREIKNYFDQLLQLIENNERTTL
ncbi:GntR family transcriptional regulator [Glutamicibacter sp. JL.03c]|uniref:GntR family transcriptional regulator n=1 Tax=Glutamicibacter sp. JL.03c TaxID=2984842 RepID=UPI0021F78841|nr:GntR family transcriptional regulator [Glutamicibacter sp. JL.03c]UYQ77166.1 GntR family transcriptional regulator [Glutamicibacter sp. JL.03c]